MSQEIKAEIAILKENLSNPEVPAEMKADFKELIKTLEDKLTPEQKPKAKATKAFKEKKSISTAKNKSVPAAKFHIRQKVTAPVTKGKVATIIRLNFDEKQNTWIYTFKWEEKKGVDLIDDAAYTALTAVKDTTTKNKAGMTAAECQELIDKEKVALKKRKISAKKAAAKPESKKNVERISKATDVVEKSIKERKSAGKKPTIAELKALIKEHEEAIKMLKNQLRGLENADHEDFVNNPNRGIKAAAPKKKNNSLAPPQKYYLVSMFVSGEGYTEPEFSIEYSLPLAKATAKEFKEAYGKDELWENNFEDKSKRVFTENQTKLIDDWGFETSNEDYVSVQILEFTHTPSGFVIVDYSEEAGVSLIHKFYGGTDGNKRVKNRLAELSNATEWEDLDEVGGYHDDNPFQYAGHANDGFQMYRGMITPIDDLPFKTGGKVDDDFSSMSDSELAYYLDIDENEIDREQAEYQARELQEGEYKTGGKIEFETKKIKGAAKELKKETHFAFHKPSKSLVFTWDYKGYEKDELNSYAGDDYFWTDVKDQVDYMIDKFSKKDFEIIERKNLIKKGYNLDDYNSFMGQKYK